MADAYEAAGVNLQAGYDVVKRLKAMTHNSQIGNFGGTIPFPNSNHDRLVAGTDGVGTKLLVAIEANRHTTIGIDLVAMCVNDVLAQGATPLFFLDYLGLAKTDPEQVAAIVQGIVRGCEMAGMQLIGGETAEMPDMYQDGHYDLAGFAVGTAAHAQLLGPDQVQAGDVLLGLPSSGLHSNGYSLVRQILFKQNQLALDTQLPELSTDLQTELLKPTQIYVSSVLPLIQQHLVASVAHITGGGLIENVARAIPAELTAEIQLGSWPVLPIFKALARLGQLTTDELLTTFNMGIGMVLIVPADKVVTVQEQLTANQQPSYEIGRLTDRQTKAVSFREATNEN